MEVPVHEGTGERFALALSMQILRVQLLDLTKSLSALSCSLVLAVVHAALNQGSATLQKNQWSSEIRQEENLH